MFWIEFLEGIENCLCAIRGLLQDLDNLKKLLNFEKLLENLISHGVLKKCWRSLHFKLLIIILEYSDAIKKQNEGENEKGKENLRKKQLSEKMLELEEKKLKIQLEK